MSWVLAIDFGTTNTVASTMDEHGLRRLTVDGREVIASAVLLADPGTDRRPASWMVGDAAVRFSRRQLDRFEPNPKRMIGDETLLLAGREVPITEAIAALFNPIVAEARQQSGGTAPAEMVVTHPATWAGTRVERLLEAARIASPSAWPEPVAVHEPVAAAQQILDIDTIPADARVVVLDFGGGTVDVAVVDRHGPAMRVAGRPVGIDSLGGEDFDLRLATWMCGEAGVPDLYARRAISPDPDEREWAVELRAHARAVKEELSRGPMVPARLARTPPDLADDAPVLVNRAQLEALIRGGDPFRPGLVEAVALVDEALATIPPGPPTAGVLVVGGSSRIPLLGALITELTGRVPITRGDPTTVVADGAARLAWSAVAAGERLSTIFATGATGGTGEAPHFEEPRPGTPRPAQAGPPVRRRRRRILLLSAAVLLALGGGGVAVAQATMSHRCWDDSYVRDEEDCPVEPTPTDDTTTEPSGTGPVDTGPITTEPITTEPITTDPVTTEPVAAGPTPDPTDTTDPPAPEPANWTSYIDDSDLRTFAYDGLEAAVSCESGDDLMERTGYSFTETASCQLPDRMNVTYTRWADDVTARAYRNVIVNSANKNVAVSAPWTHDYVRQGWKVMAVDTREDRGYIYWDRDDLPVVAELWGPVDELRAAMQSTWKQIA